jgi:hypothetical protein
MSNRSNNPWGWRDPVIRLVATERDVTGKDKGIVAHSVHTHWFKMDTAYVDDLELCLTELANNPNVTQVRVVCDYVINPLPKTIYSRKALDGML